MKDTLFSNSFSFRLLTHKQAHHTDNSMGTPSHFIARMKCGSVRFVCLDGKEMVAQGGDVFYLPMGLKYHSYWTPSPDRGVAQWESYGFTNFPNADEMHYAMQILHPSDTAISYLDALAKDKRVCASSVGWLYLFLGELLPTMQEKDPDPQARLFAKAKQYIATHNDLKVGRLARHCNMSESGLYAFFRRYANTTPIALKHQLLVEEAIRLLGSTDLSIEEISRSLHFSSSAYFRKIVKEQTGKTPVELRREHYHADSL